MTKDIGLRGASRRDFVRGVFAASAALGLGPTRALDMLEKMGGSALVHAAETSSNKMVNLVWGNGSQSMMTTLFPLPTLIENPNAAFSIDSATKYQKMTLANGNKLYHRVVDGKPIFENKPVTCFISGISQAHQNHPVFVNNPANISTGGTGHLFSCASVLQNAQASLVPVIGLQKNGNPSFLPSPGGAAQPALVANDGAMVGLFSSAASQLMTRLQPAVNQALFQQYYTAFLGLAQWGDKPTYTRAKGDAKVALSLVVKNLASQLQPAAGQAAMWGGNNTLVTTDNKYKDLANTLIVTLNAFKLGLASQVVFNVFNNDPHGFFAQTPAQVTDQIDLLGRILNSFQLEADKLTEAGSSKKLGDRIVMTHHGDTTKTPFASNGWGDGNGCNHFFVHGQGLTQPGWIGDQLTQNSRVNFNPDTGKQDATQPVNVCTSAAIGATLFAVGGNGSADAVRAFYSGSIRGLINMSLTGA